MSELVTREDDDCPKCGLRVGDAANTCTLTDCPEWSDWRTGLYCGLPKLAVAENAATSTDDLSHYMASASAYTSLRVELARIFGPVQPREGQTWNEAMLIRITERLVADGR